MNRSKIQEYIDKREEQRQQIYHAEVQDDFHFLLNGHRYEVVKNYRDGFSAEQFANRFSMVLAKYDYIVGDWGYDQLRLRGFYANNRSRVDSQRKINDLDDYLYEECNFGCPFFVVRNLEVKETHHSHHRRTHNSHRRRHSNAVIRTRVDKLSQPPVRQRKNQEVTTIKHGRHRRFLMRQRPTNGGHK